MDSRLLAARKCLVACKALTLAQPCSSNHWRWERSFHLQSPSPPYFSQNPSSISLCVRISSQNPRYCSGFLSSSSQKFRRTPGRQSTSAGIDREKLSEIVELIGRDAADTESKLDGKGLRLSDALVSEILRVCSARRIPVSRFFIWVLKSHPGFKPSAAMYNQIVDNLGRLGDYGSMAVLLNELSSKGHCLTRKAFAFLQERGDFDVKDSTGRVIEMLNRVGRSCRGSGIYSLIKLFCSSSSFDLAMFVMEETAKCTSYYNVLIAAKCRSGSFQDVHNMYDEMRRFGCEPSTSSYNYLLGSLFKNKRFVEGCELLQRMEELGYCPNPLTFEVIAFHACKDNRMDLGIEFLNRMLVEGIKPRYAMHAAFIKGYFWSERAEDAYKYVLDMTVRDQCSSNMNYSLLASLFRMSGKVVEAARVLHEMMEKGLKPNFPTYIKVMKDLHSMTRGDLALQLKPLYSKFNPSVHIG
ncbi:putative tetratricopeptide-like helical domain superfamily [Dioscorea sansibarensis]